MTPINNGPLSWHFLVHDFLESAEIKGDEIMGELGAKTQNLLLFFTILERFLVFFGLIFCANNSNSYSLIQEYFNG